MAHETPSDATSSAPSERVAPRDARARLEAFDSPLDRKLLIARLDAAVFGRAAPLADASTIGRFAIVHKLGEGGMGVVYLGYDEQLDRRVAIKLLRAREARAHAQERMLREAQALARLSHPNVVQIYESGTHEGALFIAMEFVAGHTLRRWLGDAPRSRAEILAHFSAAGRGLAAAHAARLVHRDFKPDNVMVGEDGSVKVMDFGLVRPEHEHALEDMAAAALDSASDSGGSLTQTGAVMGTPAYMAPEQHRGQLADALSDQYGFCVALWEALYGRPPFAGESSEALARNVLAGRLSEPPRDADVPGWLRAALERGLARDARRRWPSMEALLTALARDPTRRRRRWLGGVGLAVALAGLGWTAAIALRTSERPCADMGADLQGVWDDGRRRALQRALTSTEIAYADDTWLRIAVRLDGYATGWVEARTAACEATRRGVQSGELLDRRMACLDRRRTELDALVTVLFDADEAVLAHAVAAVESLPRLEPCADVDALEATLPPPEDPGDAARMLALDARLAEARALDEAGKIAAAASRSRAALDEARALGHDPTLARALVQHGLIQIDLGEYEAAEDALREAYELALGLAMLDEAALASTELVYVVGSMLERHEDGLRWSLHADPLARATGSLTARARVLNNVGTVLRARGEDGRARASFEGALALYEQAHGPEHPRLADVLDNLGRVARVEGEHRDAQRYLERSRTIRERSLGPEHPAVATTLDSLGIVMDLREDYARARALFEQAIAIRERSFGPEHPEVAFSLINLGVVARHDQEPELARASYERALAILEAAYGPTDSSVADLTHNLGLLALSQGELEVARADFERALEVMVSTRERDHPRVARIHDALCQLNRLQRDYGRARVHGQRALAIWAAAHGPEHELVAGASTCLADVDLEAGDVAGARARYERALAIYELDHEPESTLRAGALTGLGRCLLELGAAVEARAPLERAVALLEDAGVDDWILAEARFSLARALWDTASGPGGGPQRDRARRLVVLARAYCQDAPQPTVALLAEIEVWEALNP